MKPTFTRLARLFVSFLFLYSLGLYAQIGPGIAPVNSPNGGFNIDGTLMSNSTTGDWVDGTGSGGFVLANSGTPLNTKTTYHLYDVFNSGTDDIFGGGDKVSDNPNTMTWVMGTANNKTDMNNALIHFTTDANGNVWFVFAADRLSNSGNAYIDFEFLQDGLTKTATGFSTTASNSTGGRTEGDFLLTVYFESGVAKFDIQRWTLVSGVWQYKTYYSSLPVNSVYAAGNLTTITVPYPAFGTNSYPQNTFIESAVNLTEVLGAIDPCASLKIKTIFVKSKTSTAPSASIKDFFEPQAISNLTLGSADAGDDDTVCSGGNYKLQGTAVPSSNYSVVSTTWSVISGNATIATPSALDSYVTVNGGSATLRLTVETHSGTGAHCIVYDDVIITSTPSPSCLISGADGPICPSTESSFSAPSSTSYLWSISGNGTISGSTTSQTVNITTGQNCNASFTLTLNITDVNGCTSSCTKTITVIDNTAPVVSTTSGSLDHTIQCSNTTDIDSALNEVPTATDNCSATPTIHLVSDVNTPNANCANAYSRVRTWNFTDGCGNTSANFVQTITVIDNTAPVVSTASGSLDHTIQCSNTTDIDSALNEVPTATDNCSATPTIHLVSDVNTPNANCANAYSRVRTWNFTDGCGNTSANFVQTITVIDNTAPVVSTTSGSLDHTIQCSNTTDIDSALNEVPTATDNCSATPTIHLVSDVNTPNANCANAYSRVRTWNFTDGCGNTSANFVQTITVIDNTAPVVSTTSGSLDHTIQCSNTTDIDSALNEVPTATDNCSATPTIHLVSDVNTPNANCANAYSRVRTWNFTDGCGNTSANFVQTITVIDNTAPVVSTTSGSLDHTIQCSNTTDIDSALNEVPTATDNCSATPTIHLVSDVNTPNANCANAYSRVRTWNFTDGCGNTSANFVQTITVIDNTAPVVSTTSGSLDHTIQCSNTTDIDSALSQVPTATDNCSATPTIHLVSDVNTPNANCANAYSRVRTWNFTDGCGNTSANFVQTITVIDNTAPVVSTTSGSLDHTIQCSNTTDIDSALSQVPTATDNCSATPTIHLVSDVNTPNANCANAYSRVRTWNFTDGCGNTSANFVQTITVIDNTAPVVSTASGSLDHTIQCSNTTDIDSALSQVPTATDNCSATPTIHLVSDVNTPNANCANAYSRVRTWNFTDGCGNTSANFVQTITVIDNTAPVVSTTSGSLDHTIQCSNTTDIDSALSQVPTATDNCSATPTIHLVSDVNTPNANCANAYSRVRTWNFTDGCGNTSADFVQTITVIDNTAPVVSTTSGSLDHTIQCSNTTDIDSALSQVPTATDNCSATPTIHLVSDVNTPNANCANAYSRVRTWNFTDGCGNTSADFVQTITVIDNTAPVVSTTSGSLDHTIQCSNTTDIDSALSQVPTATDNCSATPTIHLVSDVNTPNANCANAYSRVRTWNFTDGCGNTSANFVQTITVIDNTAPTWVTETGSLNTTIECSDAQALANAQNLFPIATDNCDTNLSNIVKVAGPFVASETCANAGTYTNTWTVKDDCGNTSEIFTQTITTQDTTAPTFIAPADITLSSGTNCYADISTTTTGDVTRIQDNCDPNPTTSFIDSDCFGNFNSASVNSGTGNYFPFTVSGFGNVSANAIKKVALAFETNQGKGRAEFILVAPNGQGIVLVAPYCNGGDCDNPTHNEKELYLPEFYPNSSNYPKWDNNNPIVTNSVQNFTPNGDLSTINTVNGLNTLVSSFEEFTGNVNGNWFIFARKDGTENGRIEFKSVCLTPGSNLCGNNKVIIRKWSVSDACSNTVAFNQIITITDTTAPTWTTETGSLNTTVECSDAQALTNAQNLFPIATDNCDTNLSNIVKVAGPFVASETCANAGTYTNTWTVTDDCGNTSEMFTQVINVIDTTVPTWTTETGSLNTTVECSDTQALANAQNLFPIATDNCDTNLSNIAKVAGPFVASETCANAGTYTNTWTVTDDCGNTSEMFTQVINVIDTTVPTWTTETGSLNTTVECSDTQALANAQNLFPIATDNCDTNLSNIAKVAGPFVASETCANAGTYTNTWTVTDDCGNTSEMFTQVINVIDTTVPTWTTETGSLNTTVECSDTQALANAQNLFPIATDNCDTNLSNIAKVAGPFVASETCANAGTYTNTWTVTDDCGNTSEMFTQVINVIDTTVPTWTTETGSLNTTVECSDTQALANAQNLFPIATDNCDTNLSNIVKVAGPFVASETCANAGTYTNTWTVTDDCGNTSEMFTQVITIQDKTAPKIITEASDRTIECDGECDNNEIVNWLANNGGAIASDNCSEVTWTNNFDTIVYNCYTSITVTFTATDACGNTAFTSAKFTAQDTTPPVVPEVLTDITVECTSNLPVILTPASNNNGFNNVTIEEVNSIELGKCENSYTLFRTLNFKDTCDNISSVSQTVHVVDNTPPTIASLPETKTITCPDVPVFEQAIATDGCSNSSLTFNDVKTEGNCPGFYSITRTWRAIDNCGNSTTASQTINVEDRTGPITTTEFSPTINVNCDAIPARPELVFTDGCSTINPAVFTEIISNQTTDSYVINRKWSVSDTCGNTSEFVQTVNVTIANSLITLTGSVCNDGDTTSIDLTSLFPNGTPTTGTWTDVSNTGKLEGNNFNATTLAVGDYIFEYTINDSNCPRSIRITVTVTTGCGGIVLPCGTIVVHNAFSPNGDGINEKFVIDNINDTNCYPDNTVEIYNRWGVLVYSTKGYNNTTNAFDGISIGQSGISQSSGLPAGTYFYILNYTSFDNDNTIQNNKKVGYLFLTK